MALLLRVLSDLGREDFKSFLFHLRNSSTIPAYRLEEASRHDTVDLLVAAYPQQFMDITIDILRKIGRNDLAQHLSQNNPGG